MPGDPVAMARLAVADVAQRSERLDGVDLPDLRQKFQTVKNRLDAADAEIAAIKARLQAAGIP